MSCTCAVSKMPPCGYCERSYECSGCGKIKHPDDHGLLYTPDGMYCDACSEPKGSVNPENFSPKCTHDMVPYQGLFESFRFCTRCDHKEKT